MRANLIGMFRVRGVHIHGCQHGIQLAMNLGLQDPHRARAQTHERTGNTAKKSSDGGQAVGRFDDQIVIVSQYLTNDLDRWLADEDAYFGRDSLGRNALDQSFQSVPAFVYRNLV